MTFTGSSWRSLGKMWSAIDLPIEWQSATGPKKIRPMSLSIFWLGATVAKRRRIAAGGRAESELPMKVIPPMPWKD